KMDTQLDCLVNNSWSVEWKDSFGPRSRMSRCRWNVRSVDLSHWFSTRQVCAQEGSLLGGFPTWRSRVLETALRLRPRRALSSAPGQSSHGSSKLSLRKSFVQGTVSFCMREILSQIR